MGKRILISDPTLRDGNHAVRHQITESSFASYCAAAEAAGVPIVEVGHGNGIGASSMLVGECSLSDETILRTARANLSKSKLGIHAIPGFCTIQRHLTMAMEHGVDVFRIASHCTEADITQRHIDYVRNRGKEVFGVLMMSHMTSPELLADEARKMEAYGAEAVVIMDSAGAYLPADVTQRVSKMVDALNVPVGFHAHNTSAWVSRIRWRPSRPVPPSSTAARAVSALVPAMRSWKCWSRCSSAWVSKPASTCTSCWTRQTWPSAR